jgi:hypothetical protein
MLLLCLAFASAAAREPSFDQGLKAKNLFIIVANGVRYDDALGNPNHLYTETIWTKLRSLGTIYTRFYNTGLTYPIPAQASLLTGVWHKIENPLSETIRPAYPTLFEYWNKYRKSPVNAGYFAAGRKSLETASFSDHKDYGKAYAPVVDTGVTGGIDTVLLENAAGVMANGLYQKAVSHIFRLHPSFVYLNMDTGTGSGPSPEPHECRPVDKAAGCEGESDLLNAYYESIILTDSMVYDLWDRIQHDETYKDNSIFIFLSTHGRHTDDYLGFGDKCRGCQQLNVLIIGPGVKKDYLSKKKRTLIDICPTVGMLCEIPTPYAKGAIMKELLE